MGEGGGVTCNQYNKEAEVAAHDTRGTKGVCGHDSSGWGWVRVEKGIDGGVGGRDKGIRRGGGEEESFKVATERYFGS